MPHKTVRSASFYTPTMRGIWLFLHEKRQKDGNKNPIPPENQKHEAVGLIPKLDLDPTKCANYMQFANVVMSVVPHVPEWNGQYPTGANWPIKDGDTKAAKYPFMAGHWVINFSANYPPKVALLQNGKAVDLHAKNIGGVDAYKSGDFCVMSTYAFSYDNKSRGVKFDMEGVLFVGVGEAIGAESRSASQIFEGVNAAPVGLPMPAVGTLPMPVPAAPQPGPAPQPQQYAPPVAPAAPAAPAAPVAPQYAAPAAPAAPNYPAPPMPPGVPMPPR